MQISKTILAILASGAISAPTRESSNQAKDVIPFIPEPYNITVPPTTNITNGTVVNATTTPTDLAAGEVNVSEAESSAIEGMSEEKMQYFRSLIMSQAREHYKRDFPAKTWNSSAYNTSQPGYPPNGDPVCRGHGYDTCSVFGGDDRCDLYCKKCPGPHRKGKQGHGKCGGFLLFKNCHCSYE